ncbi:MAG: glycosyltransferase [Alphaproteobacteria bacterium]|jgi:predicted glycosyltransferase|nr:glycosyltransferase [Alphaproteobacteria bacterium]
MSGASVFFYVQHLLGIGHLRRAATLARALSHGGLDVTLASGGMAIPVEELGGAQLVQLPAVRATDMSFKQLVDADGRPVDEAWRDRRRDALLAAWRQAAPAMLLFELFPFGRWGMRFELLPLLEAARQAQPRPLVVASVRDILVAKTKPERYDQMVDLAAEHFDQVLVHGDPALISFYDTLPQARRIEERIHYTGYVVDESGRRGGPGQDGFDEILVSAGGGRVGQHLLECAIRARALSCLKDRTWRVLAGYHLDEAGLTALRNLAPVGVVVERARADFPSLLMNCTLSISQAGYNTIMEALRAGCRIVASPYAGQEETEQTRRAELLAAKGALEIVPEESLTPESLAAAVDRAMAGPAPAAAGIRTDGAATSLSLISDWLTASRARPA